MIMRQVKALRALPSSSHCNAPWDDLPVPDTSFVQCLAG